MEIKIGPCILSQRTPYSKYRLFNSQTHEDVTKKADKIFNKLIKDYEIQKACPKDYFAISSNSLTRFLPKNTDDIKYAFIPEDIVNIEEEAFRGAKMSYVSLPSSLKMICQFAFWKCTSLNFIEIPDTVLEMEPGAFSDCSNLVQVILPKEIEVIKSQTFKNCYSLSNIIIPDKVYSIGPSAFANCTNLENIRFGTNVQTLNSFAFLGCESLIDVDLPASITSIGERCFSNCYNLKKITLPDNVYKLYGNIFAGCDKLEEINVPKELNSVTNTPFSQSNIKSLIFNHDLNDIFTTDGLIERSNINKLIISNSVKRITPAVFTHGGENITKIDYRGTKEEFDKFKKNNKRLFEKMPNLMEINFFRESLKDLQITVEER